MAEAPELAARIAEINMRAERFDVDWLRTQLLKTMRTAVTGNWILSGTIVSLQAAWIAEECKPGMAGVYVHNSLLGPGCLPDQMSLDDRWLGFGETADQWSARRNRKLDSWHAATERLFTEAGLP